MPFLFVYHIFLIYRFKTIEIIFENIYIVIADYLRCQTVPFVNYAICEEMKSFSRNVNKLLWLFLIMSACFMACSAEHSHNMF